MEYKNQYVAVETAQCSTCNLDCIYCYIPKNKALQKINKNWKHVYRENKFYEILSEKFSISQLESIGLWGGEPSMGFKDLKDVNTLFTRHPSIKSITTSTNLTSVIGHKYLLTELNKTAKQVGRKITFDVQVSIDGTEEATNKNRGKNVYKSIMINLDKIIEIGSKLENIELALYPKSTNVADDYEGFAKDRSKLYDYIKSFDGLDKYFQEKVKDIKNINGGFKTLPTLALPGDYTKQDGIYFAKYHETLEEVIKTDFPSWNNMRDQYYIRLLNLIKNSVHIYRNDGNRMFSCSAGKSMMALDPDGSQHGCHGSFWYNYEEYLETTSGQVDWCAGERILEFDKNRFWEANKALISGYRDEYNESRLNFITQSFVYHLNNYVNVTYGTIKALVIAGQINPIFKNDDWAKIFSVFISLSSSCWYNNYMVTGSLSVTPLSIYRMYGNGMFENMARRIAKDISP